MGTISGGKIRLHDGTRVHDIVFSGVAIEPVATAARIEFLGCRFLYCDLSAVEWGSFSLCQIQGGLLPERGERGDAVDSLVREGATWVSVGHDFDGPASEG